MSDVRRKYPPYWIEGTVSRIMPHISFASKVIGPPEFHLMASGLRADCSRASHKFYIMLRSSETAWAPTSAFVSEDVKKEEHRDALRAECPATTRRGLPAQ